MQRRAYNAALKSAEQDFWQADLTVPNLAGADGALRADVLKMMQG